MPNTLTRVRARRVVDRLRFRTSPAFYVQCISSGQGSCCFEDRLCEKRMRDTWYLVDYCYTPVGYMSKASTANKLFESLSTGLRRGTAARYFGLLGEVKRKCVPRLSSTRHSAGCKMRATHPSTEKLVTYRPCLVTYVRGVGNQTAILNPAAGVFQAVSSHLVHKTRLHHHHHPSWHQGVETRPLLLRPLPSWHHRPCRGQMRRNLRRVVSSPATFSQTAAVANFSGRLRRHRLSRRRTRSGMGVASLAPSPHVCFAMNRKCPPETGSPLAHPIRIARQP